MLEISNLNCIEECNDWMSKKELMDFYKCSKTTIEQIINKLNSVSRNATQSHIKKGGYHNREVFYDGYLVKLIQAKLLSNKANQGNNSDTIKSIVKTAVKNEQKYIYSAKEIWELSNVSSRTWDRFVAEFLTEVNFDQKGDYLEEHPSRNGGNKYTEKTLKTFQAWLMRNKANQGNNSDTIKSIVKTDVKNECGDWMSKKELMDFCKCSKTTLEQIISKLSSQTGLATQSHIKKGGYHNSEVFYDDYLVKLIQAKLLSNQTNQGKTSDTIKSIVKSAVKNELTKTLSKDEIKIELARAKVLELQSKAQIEQSKAQIEHEKAQKQIITEQERTKREVEKTKRKETELELIREKKEFARQQSIKKALKIKNFTEPLKQELKTMSKELAQAAIQAEYTKKLKQLDADGKYMLYIFHNPTNPTIYKIGKSNSLGNRLAIGTSENPNLQILYKKWCNCQMACDELEETIHQELKEYNYNNYSDTGSKEWFVLTKEKLNEIVNKYGFIQSSY